MACSIGGCGVRTVGNQGIVAGSGDHCVVFQFFHSQQIIVLAVGHALGKDAGNFTGLERHAVTHEEDHVLCLLHSRFMDHIVAGGGFGNTKAVLCIDSHFYLAGLSKVHIIDAVRSHTVSEILCDCFLTEELLCRNTVHLYVHGLQVLGVGYFHIEIKASACPELGGVYRKNPDIRCLRRKCAPKKGTSCQYCANSCFHPCFFHTSAPSLGKHQPLTVLSR